MYFTSFGFLPFLAAAVVAFYALPRRLRWAGLLCVSLIFYLLLDVKGLAFLALAAAAVWACALRIQRISDEQQQWTAQNKALPREERKAAAAAFEARKKRWLLLALAVDIGLLFLLKYCGILSLQSGLFVPLGISYYTLQLAGYIIDVYRTVIPAQRSFLRLMTYALFFLSIVQGPFHRYQPFEQQLQNSPDLSAQRLWDGARRMAWGYFLKLAIADRAAVIVSTVFADPQQYSGFQLLMGMFAFGLELYTDFAGYTHIALGAGQLFGLELPDNFRQPFFSRNMSEFWKRWHITLGLWLQDYLFYPLLKSAPFTALGRWLKGRVSKKAARSIPTYLGMLILWLAIGLWHGAGFNYVFGVGLLQFLYIFSGEICAPLLARVNAALHVDKWPRLWRVWQGLRCTLLMIVAWVFFRAESFGQAVGFLQHMVTHFGQNGFGPGQLFELGLNRMGILYLLVGVVWVAAVDVLHERGHHLRAELDAAPLYLRWPVYLAGIWCMAFMGIFLSGGSTPFLYAHF